MKGKKSYLFLFLIFCMLWTVPTLADTAQNGWKVTEAGYQYYLNGKVVRGFRTIGGNTFYFNEQGYLQRYTWIERNGKKYRTDGRGVVIRNSMRGIDGQTYYFRANGTMLTGTLNRGNNSYYFNTKGWLLKNAWVYSHNKTFRTDSKGAFFKDKLVTINKKVYYFRPTGTMLTGWKKFAAGTSYFGKDGARCTGVQTINGKTYVFGSSGYMLTGTRTVGNTTYYLNDSGVMEMKQVGNAYYDSTGKAMDATAVQDYLTLQTAKGIAASITNASMTKEQKLQACFDWVISKPYITWRTFSNFQGWPAVYANDHFTRGGGDCQADAAAFAYLAKAIGYTNVYVCVDALGIAGEGHSWTEINGLVYDPLFAEAKNYNGYYGTTYGAYGLAAILHIAIS